MYLKASSVYRSVGLHKSDKNALKKMALISSGKVVQIRKLTLGVIFVIAVFLISLHSNSNSSAETNKLTVVVPESSVSEIHIVDTTKKHGENELKEAQGKDRGRIIMRSVNEPDIRVQELIDPREIEHEPIETPNNKQMQLDSEQPAVPFYGDRTREIISETNYDEEKQEPQLSLVEAGAEIPSDMILEPDPFISNSVNLDNEHLMRNPDYAKDPLKPNIKKILIWNDYWESKALWHKIFREIIYDKCPHSTCLLTSEKSQLTSSDAVLFHLLDLHKEKYRVPEYRDPKQIWIAMTFEPPYILTWAGVDFPRLNGVFNRTMTYRLDADIVIRHGRYVEISQDTVFPNFMSTWINSHDDIRQRNYAQGKRRLVAWFASSRDCKSQSNRETYVHQLQQYVPVDIYGSCGPYKCGIQKTIRHPYKVEHDDCYMLLSVAYKFYLSFENSICEDYVTEKLYNNLKLNVIPVVFGGGNYSFFAPPHSVIDATKFTPKELADYLQLLDGNDELYNAYFDWKKDYYIEAQDGIPFICDLCDKINQPEWETERKVYDKFDSWYEGKCYPSYPGNETIPYSYTRLERDKLTLT